MVARYSTAKLLHVFAHDKLKEHPLLNKLKAEKVPVFFASDGILKDHRFLLSCPLLSG